jgi:hypothetical protein
MQMVFAPNSPIGAAALHSPAGRLDRWLGDIVEVRKLR